MKIFLFALFIWPALATMNVDFVYRRNQATREQVTGRPSRSESASLGQPSGHWQNCTNPDPDHCSYNRWSQKMTCSYTEASCHRLTIPSGCHSVNAMAIGGAGGNNGHFHGGLGARIITDLEVTEGKTLYINVGANGEDAGSTLHERDLESRSHQGWKINVGGQGSLHAASGGGSSDIRWAADLSVKGHEDTRLCVAAGGGGAGQWANGGHGGHLEGQRGVCKVQSYGPSGGTQTCGGSGKSGWLYGSNGGRGFGGGFAGHNDAGGGSGYFGGGQGFNECSGAGGSSFPPSGRCDNTKSPPSVTISWRCSPK